MHVHASTEPRLRSPFTFFCSALLPDLFMGSLINSCLCRPTPRIRIGSTTRERIDSDTVRDRKKKISLYRTETAPTGPITARCYSSPCPLPPMRPYRLYTRCSNLYRFAARWLVSVGVSGVRWGVVEWGGGSWVMCCVIR